ncbi:type I polyketide synthase [Aspergillus stella-maris]|uniref:type I polyketide synthase n=1 Tax=Aspergillus stella-maris TaxID=1810926 RepID=UPI003CCE29E6
MPTRNLIFFDNCTRDRVSVLRKLVHNHDSPLLQDFTQQTALLLREEVARQPLHVHQHIPPFADIVELVERSHDRNYPILDYALLAIYQIGSLLLFSETNNSLFSSTGGSTSDVLGVETGLIAAAAVAVSRDAIELSKIGPSAVVLALRLGTHIHRIAQLMGPEDRHGKSSSGYGSMVLESMTETEVEAVLAQGDVSKLPLGSKPYIKEVYNDGRTVVTGPFEGLLELTKLPALEKHVGIITPTAGCLNAPHIYDSEDVEGILRGWCGEDTFRERIQQRSISSSNRTTTTGENGYQLVKEHLSTILQDKSVFSTLCSKFAATSSEEAEQRLFAFGRSSALSELLSALHLQDCSDILPQVAESTTSASVKKGEKIAIVGYSGRFPGAADAELLWELLRDGRDVHREVPPERFDIDAHYDATASRKNTTQTRYGAFVDNPGLFDPRFFNVSPREAFQMDPVQRLTLITAYEALEMAGTVAGRTPSTQNNRIGTFYGQAGDDWREVNSGQDIDTYFIPSGIRAFTPGRVNYHFKFSGPSYNVDTACSSSFAAIQIACTSLANGECDTAITGGVNIMTNPDIFAGLSRGYFLSPTGQCKTFDDKADGYCRADGVSSIILKRLEDAEADNDNILAVILGSKTNHSAEAASITRPHHGAQAFLCRSIMEQAGVDPHAVEYVEMHGTGTQAGDYNEMLSVSEVFASEHTSQRSSPLYVGAVKANIGHGEAASGAMSLIKVLKMLEHNSIPPNVGIQSGILNTKFPKNLTERNLHIPMELTHWAPHEDRSPRVAFLNNFSAAGGNTALLLEEGPQRPSLSKPDPRSRVVISISARSQSALKNNMNNLASYLASKPSTSVADLSYTTTARRLSYNYRIAFSAPDIVAVQRALDAAVQQEIRPIQTQPPKVAFAFTGQGAMYCSLARSLFETSSQFRSTILICEKLAKAQGFASFLPVIDGSVSDLAPLRPLVVQLATACVQIALVELWASWGIKPAAVVGHSIGEYAALYAAGSLSASEVIHAVGSRAELMEKLCTAGSHGMLAVKCSSSALSQYLNSSDLDIACENSPEETVVAGLQGSIDSLAETLSARGLKNKKLAVTHAFHSSQMDPLLSDLVKVAGSVRLSPPKIPIISSLLGRVLEADDLTPQYLVRHTRDSVRFSSAVSDARDKGIIDDMTVWVEIGSHPICSGILRTVLGSETVGLASLQKSEDPWTTLSSSLAALFNRGLPVSWNEYHRDFEQNLRLLTLPPYAFDLKNYWIQYKNDWCLSKGDAVPAATKQPPPPPATKKQFTLTVQEILEEDFEGDAITFLAQSDISHPKLREIVLGHLVNGAGLCPSVVYAEMALTIGDYLYKKSTGGTAPAGMNVCSMEVGKPLILNTNPDEPQLIRVAATLQDGIVDFKFFSVDDNGNTTVENAECQVKFGDPEKWLRKWNKNAYMVQEQIKRLEGAVGTNASTHRVGRGMAYKLFAALVNYADSFRGMDEVVLDADAFEAAAKVTFKAGETGVDFFMDPRWIDNLCHISGFIVNGSEATASDEQVYISHGWESLRFGAPISRDKTYRCYARMGLTDNANSAVRQGDVYILDGDMVVGVAGGVKFQCVPRKILNHLLPPVSNAFKAGTAPAKGKSTVPAAKPTSKIVSAPKVVSRSAAAPAPTTTRSKPAPVAATVSVNGPSSTKVISIIADECGVELAELNDSSAFEDFGLDSLLSLTILAKLREDLDMDLPSSFFVDNPTVGALKAFLGSSSAEEASENVSVLTPSRDSSPSKDSVVERQTTTINRDDSINITIRTLLSEELGVSLDEITDDADLADMGMDSLMSLSVTAGIREQTELTVPDDILIQCTTVAQLEQALGLAQPAAKPTTTPAVPQPVPPPTNTTQTPQPKALSFLIQGNPRTARETVFFFPDGSGSATSYAPIPPIGDDVCAYALNCPFMKIPEQFKCGIDGVSAIYLDEVKRRQPKGPYNFGGWSAGGVMAYEAALQLQAQGETVSRLLLIDCPCPVKLEPVPSKLFRFFDSMGVLGDRSNKKSPPYLIPHFEAMIRNLDTYIAKPFPRGTGPKVLAIWARDGVCKNPGDPRPIREPSDPKVMDWLLDNRTDLGPNGWDQLIGKENFTCVSMDGNHFSMIVDPLVKELGRLLRQHY